MIKLPIANKGVTLQEIPGEVSVFFEIGCCIRKCRGCHSAYLQEPLCYDLWTEMADMIAYAKKEQERGATAIVLMGGTTNDIPLEHLLRVIYELNKILPVGLYSGASVNSSINNVLMERSDLRWLKAGEYIKKLGGLTSPTTNQRFYAKNTKGAWEDKTSLFNSGIS